MGENQISLTPPLSLPLGGLHLDLLATKRNEGRQFLGLGVGQRPRSRMDHLRKVRQHLRI